MQHSFTTSNVHFWWPQKTRPELAGEVHAAQDHEAEHEYDAPFTPLNLESDLSNTNDQAPRRIYILGGGVIAKFVAHAIAGIPNRPPITFLFRSVQQFHMWKAHGCSIDTVTDGLCETRSGFESEVLASDVSGLPSNGDRVPAIQAFSSSGDELDANLITDSDVKPGMIDHLIVSLKGPQVVGALSQVARRLSPDSTVLFFQHGLGIIDEVNEKIFPDESTRPSYIIGVLNHALYSTDLYAHSITHADMGTTALGILPREMLKPWTRDDYISYMAPSARYLLRTLTRTPVLAAVGLNPTDILQYHIERLAADAVINPLTVIFDCRIGDLLYNRNIMRVIRLLLAEISLVVRSLPEFEGVPNVTTRFAPDRLENRVIGIAKKKADSYSTMLRNVKSARATEVDYMNGYFVRRGEELGIKCVMNYMLMQMVKGKAVEQKTNIGFLPALDESDIESL